MLFSRRKLALIGRLSYLVPIRIRFRMKVYATAGGKTVDIVPVTVKVWVWWGRVIQRDERNRGCLTG